MALKILIVDPDTQWLSTSKSFFKEQLYDVDIVSNGKDAQLSIYNNKYFAVVLNYETQSHSGPQVIRFMKQNFPAQKVIVVFNEKKLFDSEDIKDFLKKLGIYETHIKTSGIDNLACTLEGHQGIADIVSSLPKKKGVSAEVELGANDELFTRIRIDEFYSAQAVLFDVFVRLDSGRYVKILHAGDTFSKERIDKYRNEKKIEHLYFYKRDSKKYVKFCSFLAEKSITNKKVSATTKVNMLKNVSEKFLESTFSEGLKPQAIEQGKEICSNIYKMVEKQDDLYKIMRDYNDFDPNSFTHAYLVTLFSSMIIKQFEWQSQLTIEATAFACMFHDIGKMKLPPELAKKDPETMNENEYEQYKQHPALGVELLESNRTISNVAKQIVIQHHEYYNGTGFPAGIKGPKILTLANIVALANDFTGMLMREDGKKPVEILRMMLVNQEITGRYNSMIVENFIKAFAAPPKTK